jgi:hypothetical protein
MTMNVTNKIQYAMSQKSSWNREKFVDYLDKFAKLTLEGSKDWDEFAGERWGIISSNKTPLVYLNKNFPLAFIQDSLIEKLATFDDLVLLSFQDIHEEIYALDESFFEQWSYGRSKTGELKDTSLSVSDIWWATVL